MHKCHVEAKIIHRDIKPDNLVFSDEDDLVLADFGCSKRFVGEDDIVRDTIGTFLFYAPEVVETGERKTLNGRRVDIWAVGVTIFYMAAKRYPFTGRTVIEFSQNLKEKEIDFNVIREREPCSEQLNLFIRFLKKLLTKDPLERATV